ncbi:CDP-glucose 4,6-dehydratase [Candidatus Desantisbacteria bacterium]|nr:CDP-glucose 4,6-dehydratase [Candidatus Desantisbacteria bacterium]
MISQFEDIYKGKTVLVTGHTGFKGSWLCLWLKELGAKVIGYALLPQTNPNHIDLLNLNITSITGNIKNPDKLDAIFKKYKPEIVFHLAAQPLVRYSYLNPVETFETNVMGTINIFETCRNTKSVKAIINITSDKCYANKEWVWGYREIDPMGGFDPYSASKGCSELVTVSYRNSFFTGNTLLASTRAGNVIGGGDWAEDRIVPDIMKAVNIKEKVLIRNPEATRPWQYVLEPLSGYLLLGQKLLEGKKEFSDAWNFGPKDENNVKVETLVKNFKKHWNKIDYKIKINKNNPHEAGFLKLDWSKALLKMKWMPNWDFNKTIEMTVKWYKEFYENKKIISLYTLNEYIKDAESKNLEWIKK